MVNIKRLYSFAVLFSIIIGFSSAAIRQTGKPASLTENNSPDWVPSLQLGYQKETSVTAEERYERAVKRAKVLEHIDQPGPSSKQSTESQGDLVEIEQDENMQNNKASQTVITAVEFSDMVVSLSSGRPTSHVCRSEISYNSLKDNDNKTKYYTGFNSFKKFEVIVKYCEDYISASVNTVLDAPNQILLTLMKLRLNSDFKDLGFRFNIHPSTASKYFHSVINVMYHRFKKCVSWSGRDIIKKTTPSFFRDSFGTKVVVIIDCFELFIEKPSNLLKAAQCWSNYKHAYTLKYLIGITPQGTICFISEAWGGRASDKHVTIHSKFLDNILLDLVHQITVPRKDPLLVPSHLIEAARKLKQIPPKSDPQYSCLVCDEVVDGILSLRRSNVSRKVMVNYMNKLCGLYTQWGTEACKGRVNIGLDTILYIIDKRKDMRPARFCAIYFQNYGCEDPDADAWSIPLPPYPTNKKTTTLNQDDSESLQILQITDVHLDALYKPGSNSKCSEPLCCESGTPADSKDAAGYWGDYNVCDMPWHTIESMMMRIKEKHKHLDWIYFTGDIVDHRSWASSIQSNSESMKLLFQLLAETFPGKTVFPVLGNHDSHPADWFSPESVDMNANVSTQWLFDLVANEWSRWLPNATLATIRKGGYYTVLVKPGFRIVALNSNVGYTSNLWLVYENKDTYNQLHWLVDVLADAEKNGEKVHILSHFPSSDTHSSLVKEWSREFKRIVLRFSDTIAAQINGHTHFDEFKLFFNSTTLDEVNAVAYVGGSFATYFGSNPDYRIYEVDNVNMTVTDYSEYIFNLTEANYNGTSTPSWYKLYSFKEAYGLPDLTSNSLRNLYFRMASNSSDNDLVNKYFSYVHRDSDVYNKQGCDNECKRRLVCLISAVETSESVRC